MIFLMSGQLCSFRLKDFQKLSERFHDQILGEPM